MPPASVAGKLQQARGRSRVSPSFQYGSPLPSLPEAPQDTQKKPPSAASALRHERSQQDRALRSDATPRSNAGILNDKEPNAAPKSAPLAAGAPLGGKFKYLNPLWYLWLFFTVDGWKSWFDFSSSSSPYKNPAELQMRLAILGLLVKAAIIGLVLAIIGGIIDMVTSSSWLEVAATALGSAVNFFRF